MNIDFGYLAGLIDGDGYIAVYPDGSHSPQIVITSGNRDFLEILKNKIGSGGIYEVYKKGGERVVEKKDKRYTFRSSYNYVIGKQQVVREILEKAVPHLILKRDVALKALERLNVRRIG